MTAKSDKITITPKWIKNQISQNVLHEIIYESVLKPYCD